VSVRLSIVEFLARLLMLKFTNGALPVPESSTLTSPA
jgi:hypothetical protein